MNACTTCGEILAADVASCPKCETPIKEALDIDTTPRVTSAAGRMPTRDNTTAPGAPIEDGFKDYRQNVYLGVVYFNHDARVGIPMQNVDDITSIETINPSGSTGMAGGIRLGTSENLSVSASKRIEIEVSDGDATDSQTPGKSAHEDAVDAATEAIEKNITMAIIGMGNFNPKVLEDLASAPSYVETTGVSNIKDALTKMTQRTTKNASVSEGIAVTLVIDESGSMHGQEQNVRKAVLAVLEMLKELR